MDQKNIDNLKARITGLESEIQEIKKTLSSWEAQSTAKDPNKKIVPEKIAPPKTNKPKRTWEDWEFLLGGNWMAKVGVVAILLATAWFLDLAFTNNWITDSGKIYIGLFFGLGFVGGGNYFSQKGFRILTPALVGGGFSILYLTLFSAYRYYSYFGIEEVFIYLSLLSILVIALSEYTKNEIIFIFGFFGSLLSPILLSTGENSYKFLFFYLFMNLVLFAWASRGLGWKWAPLMVFFSNWLVFDVWMFESVAKSSFFVSLIFLLVLVGFFLYRELVLEAEFNRLKSFWVSKIVLIGSLLIFVGNLYYIIDVHYSEWENLSFLVGSLIALGSVYKLKDIDYKDWKVPTFLYLGLGLLYLAILQEVTRELLTFSLVTLAFLFSSMILTGENKSKANFIISLVLWTFAFLRLLFVEPSLHFTNLMFWNLRFTQYLYAFIGLLGLYWYTKKINQDGVPRKFYAISSVIVLLVGSLLEINFGVYDSSLRNQGYNIVFAIFALFFLTLGFRYTLPNFRKIGIGFLVIIIGKFVLYDIWLLSLVVKIIAGFIMGILLIVLGLFYEKLKTKILGEKI
ncbi:MAG: DUF2339 domain-containing protein [Leptospira sp.]|nr:DUF2339 domain-containing protein [Leptospira sp.]